MTSPAERAPVPVAREAASAVVLIGPMGAGKTSIGRRVAKALALPFTDTDAAVAREHGPLDTVFATHGEKRFREFEREAVRAALATGGVVSLGGGAVLDPNTRADLARHRVVLLTVTPEVVAGRIRGSNRPLLQTEDPVERWTAILRERRPLYDAVADIEFDTSTGPLQDVVDAIVEWVRSGVRSATAQEET